VWFTIHAFLQNNAKFLQSIKKLDPTVYKVLRQGVYLEMCVCFTLSYIMPMLASCSDVIVQSRPRLVGAFEEEPHE